ncbi:MAG: hypothetical protein CVU39_00775 [Chloroflexi bacterium HGW-Chloroflexi-10]|nr:MAG: hypothetical protein CVU39_00775 [Chloroflexi bacterium HGW-Chloroflexi-10]
MKKLTTQIIIALLLLPFVWHTVMAVQVPSGDSTSNNLQVENALQIQEKSQDIINSIPPNNKFPAANSTTSESIFLPLVLKNTTSGTIFGSVTFNGTPIENISLQLRFFDGTNWSTLTTTNTTANGSFIFRHIPGLASGQKYYVLYQNPSVTIEEDKLFAWNTRALTAYNSDQHIEIGNFDIANIVITSPNTDTSVALPSTFLWVTRPATPNDSYAFNMYKPVDINPLFITNPPLGYVNSFTLESLPAGFNTNTTYFWEVYTYSADGGYGISNKIFKITFLNTGKSIDNPTEVFNDKLLPQNEDLNSFRRPSP